jgi:hypothetical protein
MKKTNKTKKVGLADLKLRKSEKIKGGQKITLSSATQLIDPQVASGGQTSTSQT